MSSITEENLPSCSHQAHISHSRVQLMHICGGTRDPFGNSPSQKPPYWLLWFLQEWRLISLFIVKFILWRTVVFFRKHTWLTVNSYIRRAACSLKSESLNSGSCLTDLQRYGRDVWTVTWNPVCCCLLYLFNRLSVNTSFVYVYYLVNHVYLTLFSHYLHGLLVFVFVFLSVHNLHSECSPFVSTSQLPNLQYNLSMFCSHVLHRLWCSNKHLFTKWCSKLTIIAKKMWLRVESLVWASWGCSLVRRQGTWCPLW